MTTYYGWLTSTIVNDSHPISSYGVLLRSLYFVEYVWPTYIPLDESRASNGLFLRSIYEKSFDENGQDPCCYFGHLDGRCSVLEMMVALARDMEFLMGGLVPSDNLSAEFFWAMIDNLGLSNVTNSTYDNDPGLYHELIYCTLDTLLNHQYDAYGNGSLFILREPRQDSRTSELWWQANLWLQENYGNYLKFD